MCIPDGIRIGVSACLLGHRVRYDGGHRRNAFITDTLSRYARLVPVCPEVECGLPVPRATLHLAGDPCRPRLVVTTTGKDHTRRMAAWTAVRLQQLEKKDLCAFIFKKKSPSCGMMDVKVFGDAGQVVGHGRGIFADRFMVRFLRIPVQEEDGLDDAVWREDFITQILVMQDWRKTLSGDQTRENLIHFHGRTMLQLRLRSPQHMHAMNEMLASEKNQSCKALYRAYEVQLMAALRFRQTYAASCML